MDSNIEIIPQESSIIDLLNAQDFLSEYQDINEEIGNTRVSIDTTLARINNIEPSIKIGKTWVGTPKQKDIEDSISNVFSVIRPHILSCGDAIRSTNNNLQRTLSLIKLIAAAESTIYQQFDEQITNQNELKEIISDWCKQNGIHDEQINELLESSFQRAYTLRDRINQVKLQVSIANKELSETTKIAKSTKNKVSQLDERLVGIDRYISETKEADSKRDERLVGIDRYLNETKTEYQELRSSYLKMKRGNTILWFVIIGQFVLLLLFFIISITNGGFYLFTFGPSKQTEPINLPDNRCLTFGLRVQRYDYFFI